MRRAMVLCTTGLLAAVSGFGTAQAATAPEVLVDYRQARKACALRRRRMIFNNDGDDVIYRKNEPSAEGLLAERTAPLLGSQVDTIVYSNSLCFGDALHASKVFSPFLCTDYIFKDNCLPDLLPRGLDPIAVMGSFCRKHGIEIFWDMRMNDTHDALLGGYGPYLFPTFKRDNPAVLCGSRDQHPPYGTWSAVDYARPEVREAAFRFFEEVCTRFDIDGIELDFLRHPCFFKTVAHGQRATAAEVQMMTDLVRRIRTMTENVGIQRGRPLLVLVRIPDSVEYGRGIGLDVTTWLEEGLFDILTGTCYFRLNPWSVLIEMGHSHDVPVYPCLSESRVRGFGTVGTVSRFNRNSLESYRGRALRAWSAGADGIYIFNYFNPKGTIWRELGDPQALQTTDKLYFVTVRDGDPGRYLVDGSRSRNVPLLTPKCPASLPAGTSLDVALVIGDDIPESRRNGWQVTPVCHVQTDAGERLQASINGKMLTASAAQDSWLDYAVPEGLLRKGRNDLRLQLQASAAPRSGAEWSAVYDAVKMPKGIWQPEPAWQPAGNDAPCVTRLQDDGLLIADRGTEAGNYAFYYYRGAVTPEDEVIAEVRVRALSGWSCLVVENGVHYEEIQFYTDRIKGRYSGLEYPMDTTEFHTFRYVGKGCDYRVFVDGVLRLDGTGKLSRPVSGGRRGVGFGAANSGNVGEAVWQSVKVRTATKSIQDVVLSLDYARP